MKPLKNSTERGQALIVIALAAIVLFGFVALAIDGSAKFSDRRHAQNAADTAALAASLEKVNELAAGTSDNSPSTGSPTTCPPPSGTLPSPVCEALQIAGKDRADSNGYNNDLVTNTVEVYSPPISGYYSTVSNKDQYIQVIITSYLQTTFMRVFGTTQTVNVAQSVSYAKTSNSLYNGASIVSLDPNPACGNGSVKVSGSGAVTLNGGGMFVNSNVGCGFKEPNCTNFVINGGGISSAGSPIDLNGCHAGSITTNTSQPQFVIPDDIFIPDEPSVCSTKSPYNQYTKSGNNVTVYPGYYDTFPPITKNSYVVTMQPGIYCIDADIRWNSGSFASLSGNNVTFYITSGHEFDMSGGILNLTATSSSSSPYANYLIIVDGNQGSIEGCTINGGGGATLTGTIFAPYCNVTVNGNSGTDAFNAQIIGYDVTLNGNNTLNFTYDPGQNAKAPRRVGLMK